MLIFCQENVFVKIYIVYLACVYVIRILAFCLETGLVYTEILKEMYGF